MHQELNRQLGSPAYNPQPLYQPLYSEVLKDPELSKMLLEALAILKKIDDKLEARDCESEELRRKYIALLEKAAGPYVPTATRAQANVAAAYQLANKSGV